MCQNPNKPSTTRSCSLALQTPDEILSTTSRLSCVFVAVLLSEPPFDFLSLRLDLELSELAKSRTLRLYGCEDRGEPCSVRHGMRHLEQRPWGVTTAQALLL